MKNKFIWLPVAVLVVAVVGTAVWFGNARTQKGSLFFRVQQPAKISGLEFGWEQVPDSVKPTTDGRIDDLTDLTIDQPSLRLQGFYLKNPFKFPVKLTEINFQITDPNFILGEFYLGAENTKGVYLYRASQMIGSQSIKNIMLNELALHLGFEMLDVFGPGPDSLNYFSPGETKRFRIYGGVANTEGGKTLQFSVNSTGSIKWTELERHKGEISPPSFIATARKGGKSGDNIKLTTKNQSARITFGNIQVPNRNTFPQ